MSLSIGIVGLPNVGKSTLFNALTKNNVLAANYPFATIEPNTGIVPVPDERIHRLGDLFSSAKVVPATVTFVDIAGIVAGAHKGEGMGNAFLSHIRETDGIAQVVRAFTDENVLRAEQVHGSSSDDMQGAGENRSESYEAYGERDSESGTQQIAESNSGEGSSADFQAIAARCREDIETINTELILADIATIDKHLPKLEKEAKRDPKQKPLESKIKNLKSKLNDGVLAINSGVELDELSYLNLLTAKPFIYVFNVDDTDVNNHQLKTKLTKLAPTDNVVFVSAKVEAEIAQLDGDDASMFMEEYGLEESGLQRLSEVGFDTLGLQTYLTAGPKESKAWTIPKNTTAPQAAGVIHGDFERGFIAADIVGYKDLVAAGSWADARTSGKLRTEGKDYVMQDGDVVEFKFNV